MIYYDCISSERVKQMANNQILNRLFTLNSFNELLQYGSNSVYDAIIKRYINDPEDKLNGEIISEIYGILEKTYRNEYYYENTLLNTLLIGVHKPKTTTALAQIPIARSIADFILINGKAVVYEIKTELDSFDRLSSQISDYYKAFSYVCVVTSENQFDSLQQLFVDSPVGIYSLTKKGSLSKKLRKEPVEYNTCLNHNAIFNMLRKREFENVIYKYYNTLPQSTPAFYYTECMKAFSEIPINKAYSMALIELKKRNFISYELIKKTPIEFRSLLYFSKSSANSFDALDSFINSKFGG